MRQKIFCVQRRRYLMALRPLRQASGRPLLMETLLFLHHNVRQTAWFQMFINCTQLQKLPILYRKRDKDRG